MDNKRLLYLVQHSNKRMFKIGIASNDSRFRDLNRDYSIDWDSSIYFEGVDSDITKMEGILHRGFYKNRLEHQNGTGGTEWFNSSCIHSVVDTIIQQTPLFDFQIDLDPKEITLGLKEIIADKKEKTMKKFDKHNYFSWLCYNVLIQMIHLLF